jgi:hypothetical protein
VIYNDTDNGEDVCRFVGNGDVSEFSDGGFWNSRRTILVMFWRDVRGSISSRFRRLLCHCIFARTGSKSVLRLEIFSFCLIKSMIQRLKM